MKLYATATSERASKGQGGNEFIAIEVKDDNGIIIADIRFKPIDDSVGDGIQFGYWFDERLMQINLYKIPKGHNFTESKGKKQKTANDNIRKCLRLKCGEDCFYASLYCKKHFADIKSQ